MLGALLVLASCQAASVATAPDGDVAPGPFLAIGVDPRTGASIATEKDHYLPGEIVHLTLEGWAAGESVRLILSEQPDTHGDTDTTVTVDDRGSWSGPFYDVMPHDLGVEFTLTGTGQASGSAATVVFWDGIRYDGLSINGGGDTASVEPGASVTYAVTASTSCVGNPTECAGSVSDDWQATRIDLRKDGVETEGACSNTVNVTAAGTHVHGSIPGTAPLAPGVYQIRVRFYQDDGCAIPIGFHPFGAALVVGSVTALDQPTTTVLDATPNPAVFGQSVTLTATVTYTNGATAPVPGGSVTFYRGGTSCADAGHTQIGAAQAVTSGVASLSTTAWLPGSNVVWACYGGHAAVAGGTYEESEDDLTVVVAPADIRSEAAVTPTTQQYSDTVGLSTTLSIEGSGALNGETLTGSVEFLIGARSVGTVPVSAASLPATITLPHGTQVTEAAQTYPVRAVFTSTSANFAAGTQAPASLDVVREDSRVAAWSTNPTSVSTTAATVPVVLKFGVTEFDGAQLRAGRGDVRLAGLAATLLPILGSTPISGACSSSGDSTEVTWTCNFASVPLDAYEVAVNITGNHYSGGLSGALAIYDPRAGLPSGGGTFQIGGDHANFGVQWSRRTKDRAPRGGLVAIRHFADGSTCKVKVNNMDAPAVSGVEAAFVTALATYVCKDAAGTTTASAGSLPLSGKLYDGGTSGAGVDKISLAITLPSSIPGNAFVMSAYTLLTGGNVWVPKPSTK